MIIIIVTTYFVFSNNVLHSSYKQAEEISRQITFNYENYIDSIVDISVKIQDDLSNVPADDTYVKENLKYYKKLNQEIVGIGLFNLDGEFLTGTDNYSNVINESWFNKAINDQTIHSFSSIEEVENAYYMTFSKYISYNKNQSEAIIKIDIDFQNMIELGNKTNLGLDGHVTIIDNNYNIIFSSNYDNEELKYLKNLTLGSKEINFSNNYYVLNLVTLNNTNFRLAIFVNNNQFHDVITNFTLTISLIVSSFVILGLIFIMHVTKKITNPLKKLEIEMLKVEKDDYELGNHIEIDGNLEVMQLTKSYNDMMDKIKNLMLTVIDEKNNQRKSELKALQNQINPHFLYNTLDSIVWLIDNDKKEEANLMVVSLAKLFRISISKGKNIIPLEDEIQHVKNYLTIQQIRYSESFEFEIDVDEECYQYKIMKLVLQPIAENAIYHGLKNLVDMGKIIIRGRAYEDFIKIQVIDNGYGMKQEKIDELYESFKDNEPGAGVGVKNVYLRLKLYYGKGSHLDIESDVDYGTTITITIPKEKL